MTNHSTFDIVKYHKLQDGTYAFEKVNTSLETGKEGVYLLSTISNSHQDKNFLFLFEGSDFEVNSYEQLKYSSSSIYQSLKSYLAQDGFEFSQPINPIVGGLYDIHFDEHIHFHPRKNVRLPFKITKESLEGRLGEGAFREFFFLEE